MLLLHQLSHPPYSCRRKVHFVAKFAHVSPLRHGFSRRVDALRLFRGASGVRKAVPNALFSLRAPTCDLRSPWPYVSSNFGQFDLAGSPKPNAYWYAANWRELISSNDAGKLPLPAAPVTRITDLIDALNGEP